MYSARWFVALIPLSLLFGLTGAHGKENAPVRQQATQVKTEFRNELPSEEIDFRIGVYESYLRLRDGVEPIDDKSKKREILQDYVRAFQGVREANKGIRLGAVSPAARQTEQNCLRFVRLYENVGLQLVEYYTQLLENSLDPETQAYIEARLQILRLFETGLFSLVLFNAEAGYSEIDPSVRSACPVEDRKGWRNAMMRSHQTMNETHLAFFGQEAASKPVTASSRFGEHYHRHKINQDTKKYAFIAGEIAASILVWEKGVQPQLNKVTDAIGRTRWGRMIKIFSGALYITGLVTLDRYFRDNIDFLKPAPELADESTLSSWERLMKFGEEFAVSQLASPPLYYAYLRLIGTTERQRALDFLTENEWLLVDAEEKYGSVDTALQNLKEVAGL